METNVANLFYNGSTVPNHNVNPTILGILWENKKSNTQPYVCLDNTLNKNVWQPINDPKLSKLESYPFTATLPRSPLIADLTWCYSWPNPSSKTFTGLKRGYWTFFAYAVAENDGRSWQGVVGVVNGITITQIYSHGRNNRKWSFNCNKVMISNGSCTVWAEFPEGGKNYGSLCYAYLCIYGYARNITNISAYANGFGMSNCGASGSGDFPGNKNPGR